LSLAGARVNKRVLTTDLVVTLATYDFAAGAVIPDNLLVMNGKALTSQQNAEIPFTLIEPGLRLGRTHPFPCGWIENLTTLKLVGLAVDWASIASLSPCRTSPTPRRSRHSTVRSCSRSRRRRHSPPISRRSWRCASTGSRACSRSRSRTSRRRRGRRQTFLDSLGARRVGKVFQVQDGY
jgi:hypothetical protein